MVLVSFIVQFGSVSKMYFSKDWNCFYYTDFCPEYAYQRPAKEDKGKNSSLRTKAGSESGSGVWWGTPSSVTSVYYISTPVCARGTVRKPLKWPP